MNVDTWLYFLHILGAMAWVGGGVMLLVGARAQRSGDPRKIADFARTLRYTGLRALPRAVIVVLVTGVWQVLDSAAWHLSQAWVILALVLFGLSFLIEAVYLSRIGLQLERAAGAGVPAVRPALASRPCGWCRSGASPDGGLWGGPGPPAHRRVGHGLQARTLTP